MLKEQKQFTLDIARLIFFAYQNGYELTLGHGWRTMSQQTLYYSGYKVVLVSGFPKLKKSRKLTNTLISNHAKRLAQDYNIFYNGELTWDKAKTRALGDYWESLDNKNNWGGNIKVGSEWDVGHFERRL